jgi:GTP-binding protein
MEIKNAVFIKSLPSIEGVFEDALPHIVFVGRSNVGKSSTINALTKVKSLAKTSNTPGATRQINMFLVNNKLYIIDLPGYGFVKGSKDKREVLHNIIEEYLTYQKQDQKVVVIIDAKVGPTAEDLDMIEMLESFGKDIVIAINKIDKLKNSELKTKIDKIKSLVGPHKTFTYSAEKKLGLKELWANLID